MCVNNLSRVSCDTTMNPEQQQQQLAGQQVPPSQLPPGVENAYVGCSYYGRPRVMITLQEEPRRRLMKFAVVLLVFGPIILGLVAACMVMRHYYLAYGFASGVLVSMHTCDGFTVSRSIDSKQALSCILYIASEWRDAFIRPKEFTSKTDLINNKLSNHHHHNNNYSRSAAFIP